MKGIITVIGTDRVGIIGTVCVYLSERGINILDISQTIVRDYLNMLMIADFSASSEKFEETAAGLSALGEKMGVEIKLRHEDIFNIMHRV